MANITRQSLLPTSPETAAKPAEIGLMAHLAELRKRLFICILALIAGTLIGMVLGEPLMIYLQQPYGREFVVLGPTSGVVAFFRVALMTGGILAAPIITYQILMFVLPGLVGREKRLILFSLPPITLLFLIGALFAWFVLIPPAIGFLEGFQSSVFQPEWTADLYLSFVTTLVFWMGVAFETPLVFFVVALLGMVAPNVLIRNWRVAIIGALVAAALITPTVDPINMGLVVIPLLVLYALSILLVAVGVRLNRHAAKP